MVNESGSESNGQKKSCAFFHEKEEVHRTVGFLTFFRPSVEPAVSLYPSSSNKWIRWTFRSSGDFLRVVLLSVFIVDREI